MRLRKKVITAKWLEEQDACEPAIEAFHTKFGEKAPAQDVAKALLRSRRCASEREAWIGWFVSFVLADDEYTEYFRAWWGAALWDEWPISLAWLRKIANS